MKKIITILGPTSCGKSSLAIAIAKIIDAEIINADCFQVYKNLDIGTNKTKIDKQNGIKHHLIDIISIDEEWDIKKFKNSAEQIIDNSSKTIILVGGSNLYIHCLLNNYKLLNNKRSNELDDKSTDELYSKLLKIDEELARKIGKNKKRLIRAIEIKSSGNELINNDEIKYNSFNIFIDIERKKLYEKINNRVEEMLSQGWVNEVKELLSKYDKHSNAFKALGYKTIIESNLNINEAIIEKIKKETRNYAKRQLTWCRNKFNISLHKKNNILEQNDIEKIMEFINE